MFISQFKYMIGLNDNHWNSFIVINDNLRYGRSITNTGNTKINTLANWGEYLNFRMELIK